MVSLYWNRLFPMIVYYLVKMVRVWDTFLLKVVLKHLEQAAKAFQIGGILMIFTYRDFPKLAHLLGNRVMMISTSIFNTLFNKL